VKPNVTRVVGGVVALAVVLVAVVFVLIRALPTREKLYEGKPFQTWFDQSQGADAASRGAAESVLKSKVVPDLLEVAERDSDPAWRVWLVDSLGQLQGVEIDFLPAVMRRLRAMHRLSYLAKLDPRIEPFLLGKITDADPRVREAAAVGLCRMKVAAPKIVPTLLKWFDAMGDDDEDGVMMIMPLLAGYGDASRAAVPHLVKLLKSPAKGVPYAAKSALEKIDPEALKTAAPAL
jgi:hypothetical protein